MADTLLEISGIETCYGRSQVLFGLSLTIATGEMVTLMGRNGMGKTTTVRSIMGLTPARAGNIRFGGRDIRGLASYRVAKLGVGLVPEGRQIFPNLTVRENLVATAANPSGAANAWTYERVVELFPRLAERATSMGNLLSGGEQQMLALARAVVGRPRLLLVDEMSLGLAPIIVEQLLPVLRSIATETGAGILVVEQHVPLVLAIADRAVLLRQGRTTFSGTAAELAERPDLVEAGYLGDAS
jgi:branched-chain amino acid transport system ATP-binding protein